MKKKTKRLVSKKNIKNLFSDSLPTKPTRAVKTNVRVDATSSTNLKMDKKADNYFTKRREEIEKDKEIFKQKAKEELRGIETFNGYLIVKARLDELRKAENSLSNLESGFNGLSTEAQTVRAKNPKNISLKDFDKFIEELKEEIEKRGLNDYVGACYNANDGKLKDLRLSKFIIKLAEKFRGKNG